MADIKLPNGAGGFVTIDDSKLVTTLTNDASGNLTTITYTDGVGNTWTQAVTYPSSTTKAFGQLVKS